MIYLFIFWHLWVIVGSFFTGLWYESELKYERHSSFKLFFILLFLVMFSPLAILAGFLINRYEKVKLNLKRRKLLRKDKD